MSLIPEPIETARIHWQADTPRSDRHGDAYWMPGRARAESETVFVQANRLPARFSQLPDNGLFILGETGFGSGLNCLLAAEAFVRHAPAGAWLHLYSAERYPLTLGDLARCHAGWPALEGLARELRRYWPPPAPGLHRIRLHPRIELTLMLGDAATLWRHADARVDAWFLDGFAPARNPDMWQPALFDAVAARSRPGATLATFTAAGSVRRGLAAAGFTVVRRPGFGDKRHRLEASRPGDWQPARARGGRVVVAGAGLAGATTARALAERGWQVGVFDPAGIAGGASGNRAGVVYTTAGERLDARNRFHLTALIHALAWFARHGFPATGRHGRLDEVVIHLVRPRLARRFQAAMDSGAWPRELLSPRTENSVRLHGAGHVDPAAWCRVLLDHPAIDFRPEAIRTPDPGVHDADVTVLCLAGRARELAGLDWLPLRPVRGQVSECRATRASTAWQHAECHDGFVVPAVAGVHVIGATFDRAHPDAGESETDDRANLEKLRQHRPQLWQELGGKHIEIVGRRAAVRWYSSDKLPLCGPLPAHPGVWLNLAHGARGLAQTPLCATLLADAVSGHPQPADTEIARALAPERFGR